MEKALLAMHDELAEGEWSWRQCGAPVEAEQWREGASGRRGAGSGVREQMRVAEAREGAQARGTQEPRPSSLGELLGRI